jgi:hypothetical protein
MTILLDNDSLLDPALQAARLNTDLSTTVFDASAAADPALMQSRFIAIQGQSGLSQWSVLDPNLQQTLMNANL